MTAQPYNPFRINLKSRFVARCIERLLGLITLIKIYDGRPKNSDTLQLLTHTLDYLNVDLNVVDSFDALENLPSGPLLIVANHPLGGLEGVALTKVLLQVRPDTKVLTNELLTRIPELSEVFIGVDILSKESARKNLKSMREATHHLQEGGALLLFPAGKVASLKLKSKSIEDDAWNRFAGKLLQKTKATCLPIYVDAYNSRSFYFFSLLSAKLRTLMLPRELSNKRDAKINLLVGKSIESLEWRHLKKASAITDYLRMCTYFLKPGNTKVSQGSKLVFDPIDESLMVDVSDTLKELHEHRLIETDIFDVYCAPYDKLGSLLTHIGVTRELTFREAGEGTGNSVDSDQFDPYYLHLFIWDKDKHCIVGGYRLGQTHEIAKQHGLDALYGRTLFKFDQAYLDQIGQCLEMGRSFIHPDYQRHPLILDLLWKGIGHYVAKHPEFHTLFGAVSISRDHSDLARAFISESMLTAFRVEQDHLANVEPVEPLKVSGKVWTKDILASLNHISVLNKLVGRCDPGKALPTLLRHYLSLNGKFVCFSVNKVFNDSLDGLILVDLRKTPSKYLNRYLGKEGAKHFLAHWENE